MILDSLIHVLLDLIANVLVLVGGTEDLVNLAIVAVEFLFIGGGARWANGLTTLCSLSSTPIRIIKL